MKKTLEAELAKWSGVESIEYEKGGKHWRLIVKTANGTRFLPFTATDTDYRGERNKVSDLRRVLRELGAVKV